MAMGEHKCCICGKKFFGWGNNPWPVVKEDGATCCDECNATKVIAARLDEMFGGKKNAERPNS